MDETEYVYRLEEDTIWISLVDGELRLSVSVDIDNQRLIDWLDDENTPEPFDIGFKVETILQSIFEWHSGKPYCIETSLLDDEGREKLLKLREVYAKEIARIDGYLARTSPQS